MAVPPDIRRSPRSEARAWIVPAAVGLAVTCGILLALHWRGQDVASYYPQCVFRKATGLHCPGCGSTRAARALWHGHVAQAFRYNPFMFVMTPFLIAMGVSRLLAPRRGRLHLALRLPAWFIWVLFVVIVVYWIARNIPVRPFTYLAPA